MMVYVWLDPVNSRLLCTRICYSTVIQTIATLCKGNHLRTGPWHHSHSPQSRASNPAAVWPRGSHATHGGTDGHRVHSPAGSGRAPGSLAARVGSARMTILSFRRSTVANVFIGPSRSGRKWAACLRVPHAADWPRRFTGSRRDRQDVAPGLCTVWCNRVHRALYRKRGGNRCLYGLVWRPW